MRRNYRCVRESTLQLCSVWVGVGVWGCGGVCERENIVTMKALSSRARKVR